MVKMFTGARPELTQLGEFQAHEPTASRPLIGSPDREPKVQLVPYKALSNNTFLEFSKSSFFKTTYRDQIHHDTFLNH